MYILTYRNKIDKEEKTLTGTTEEKCIEKYRREVTSLPQNYEIVSIVNDEEIEEKTHNDTVKEKAEKVIEEIEKTVKSMLKKPYTDSGKIRNKTIKAHSDILKYIKNNYCNGKDFIVISEKVVVNCDYCIQIEPTEEWFLSA